MPEPTFASDGAPPSPSGCTWCLLPLPSKLSDSMFRFNVFPMVAGTIFDAGRRLLALRRSLEVPWVLVREHGSFG